MKIITKKNYSYHFDPECKPVEEIASGDSVWLETMDCFSDTLTLEDTTIGRDNPRESNPVTGPLYVIGADVGDTLKVHIDDIMLRSIGIAGNGAGLKYFKNITDFKLKRMEIKDDLIKINDKIEYPIEPMIGTIGVAPRERILSVLSGDHGGNMDCKFIKKGAYVYLPVFVKGALLSIGDLHALMGDGEVGECGAETNGKVKITVEVIKRTKRMSPTVEVENKWSIIKTGKDADEAISNAIEGMYKELVEKLGIPYEESSLLITLLGNISICATNEYYTVARMDFPLGVMEKYSFIKS